MKLPEGEFDGEVYGKLAFIGYVWTGKKFTGNKVKNKIFGRYMIEGEVSSPNDHIVIIYYPQLNITDVLVNEGNDEWHGAMYRGKAYIHFGGKGVGFKGHALAEFILRRSNA